MVIEWNLTINIIYWPRQVCKYMVFYLP